MTAALYGTQIEFVGPKNAVFWDIFTAVWPHIPEENIIKFELCQMAHCTEH
jgi:hypothetical protein